MKKLMYFLFISSMLAVSASGYYEDFEDAGNLQGSLFGAASVSDGYMKPGGAADGFLADGDYPDFSGYVTFNFGGYVHNWNEVHYDIGSDGVSTGYAGSPAGIQVRYLPNTYLGNAWMYVLRNGDDPDTVWSTVYLDQSALPNPAGYDASNDYTLHVLDNGDDTITTWVEETANPDNKGKVYTIDISGETFYGDKVFIAGGRLDVGGVEELVIGAKGLPVGTIAPDSLSISEPSGSDTYVITLTEAIPAGADFRVYLDPCDLWGNGLKQAMVAPAKAGDPNTALDILFNSGNWDTPVTVTVTAFDDGVGEAPLDLSLGHRLVQVSGAALDPGTDPNWAFPTFANSKVSAAVGDDDLRMAVDVVPTALSVAEQGPTSDTYTVVLEQPPTNPLTVDINSGVQVDLDSTSLTFNSGNWSAPQTVTVTAVDDAVGEPDPQTSVIGHSVDPGGKIETSIVSEDFENPGSLSGTLYGDATVSGGLLNCGADGGFVPDFNDVVTDFEATLPFNFGGDTFEWAAMTLIIGSDGDPDPCSHYAGAPAGVMCSYLPYKQWMYIRQQDDDATTVWTTIYIDQGGCVLSGGFDPCDNYEFHINRFGDNITAWVEEVGNPGNKTPVYNIDVSGATYYGNKFVATGRWEVATGGNEALDINEIGYATQEQADWAAVNVDDVTVSITDNDCLVGRDTVVDDGDFDDDCDVDLTDFAAFAGQFLDCLKPGGGLCY